MDEDYGESPKCSSSTPVWNWSVPDHTHSIMGISSGCNNNSDNEPIDSSDYTFV